MIKSKTKVVAAKNTKILEPAPQDDALARAYLQALVAKPHGRSAEPDDSEESGYAAMDEPVGVKPPSPLAIRPDLALMAVLLAREIEKHNGLSDRMRAGAIVVIRTNDSKSFATIQRVLEKSVIGKKVHQNLTWLGNRPDDGFLIVESGTYRGNVSDPLSAAFSIGMTVVGLASSDEAHLPDLLTDCAECDLVIGDPDMSAIRLALNFSTGQVDVPELPADIAEHVIGADLVAAVRPGRSLDDACAHVCKLVTARIKQVGGPADKPAEPLLTELFGYGAARDWGLEAVADIRAYVAGTLAWDECDHRGLLLSGPPGVGKTLYARAFANSARLPLIATSVADWNATGHLGDTLKAIRKTFASARKAAPCVMFIDELDGISSRANLQGDYVEYWLQIVNLLLEELQGTTSNEGIVILGATNNPERIDPAILRSGRLDHHIRIELPDHADLQAIYRYCLGGAALDEAAISRLAAASIGSSGADVDAYVRRAKSAARRKNEAFGEAHVSEQIGSLHLRLREQDLRRLAVHEAGHAVMHHLAGVGDFRQLTLTKTGGYLAIEDAVSSFSCRSDMEQTILVSLAGHAAEELVFGAPSIGYANGDGSDLSNATNAAIAIQLVYIDRVHVSGLTSAALTRLPGMYEAVSERLNQSLIVARQMLAEELPLLNALADALIKLHHIDKGQFERICAEFGNRNKRTPSLKKAI